MNNGANGINWEAVRVLAIAVGVREAARRLEVSEEAAMKRSQREGWLSTPEAKAVNRQVVVQRQQQGRALSAGSPQKCVAQALAQEITELGSRSRIGHARSQVAIAEHIAQRDPEENLADMPNVKAAVQASAIVFGWDKTTNAPRVRLSGDNQRTKKNKRTHHEYTETI